MVAAEGRNAGVDGSTIPVKVEVAISCPSSVSNNRVEDVATVVRRAEEIDHIPIAGRRDGSGSVEI